MEKNRRKLIAIMLLLLVSLSITAQEINVSGTVVDTTGEPVIGATVMQKGSTNGTVTDIEGNFKIAVNSGATLVVTYIGYVTQEVAAADGMRVVIKEDAQGLQEVVVTGYTTQRKSDLTGAVSVVDVDELQKQNENNPIKALQGRVPGMNISADGSPSGAATVRIRGVGTLNDNDPLYIIDGVPTKSGMHELNGNDIESIQVLKDAASASIYGSRAANGVIIITTKKGKNGQVRINLDASVALSMYAHRMDVLNAEEWGGAFWQANVNDGLDPNNNSLGYHFNWAYDANGVPELYGVTMQKYLDAANTIPASDTDWMKETTRTGVVQNYNVSVSNGTERGSSYFSLGYYKNLGIINTTDFERLSARINTDYKLIGDVLTIGENLTLNRTSEVQAPGGFLGNVLQYHPAFPVYNTLGEFANLTGSYADRENPVEVLDRNKDNRYTYWRLFGDVHLNLKLAKNLNLRTTAGVDYAQKEQRMFTYPISNGNVSNSTNAVEAKQEHWMKWMWNAVASYNLEIAEHRADFLAGVELNRDNYTYFSGYRENFSVLNPDFMWPDAGSGESMAYGSSEGYSLLSFFAKANYTYAERYLFSATVRYDGSSRFGKNNRFATFPSASFGWRMGNEDFLKDVSWLNELKLRASWGQTGNQEISNVARYTIYVPNYGSSESGGQSYGTSYDIEGTNGGSILASGFKRNQIGNEDIKWETTTQTNLGVDFSFFGDSLYGSFDWFWKNTKDILVYMPGISVMGEGTGKWINAGAMKNNGCELNLGWRQTLDNGFSYDINGNISSYRNTITELPTTVAANGTFGGNGVYSVVGHAMGSQVGYIADGIFKSQEEIDAHAVQEGAGLGRIRWRDIDGDGYITEKDQDWIFDPTPAFSYGINLYFQYKGFDLTMFWQGVQGVQVISDLKKETDLWSGLNIGFLNKGVRVLDAWSPANPDSDIPALSRSDLNNEKRVSTYFIENGSFLKLRNIQIGYNLPQKALEKMKMSRMRFYLSAQNLLTIQSRDFTGVDPENPNYGYPIPVNLTFGLNIGF
ncbi:MAG: TonB-dependent receptor [Bacteroidales bacterium]|nr:TonB-dependent receptor [Bacteroidales bacterium]